MIITQEDYKFGVYTSNTLQQAQLLWLYTSTFLYIFYFEDNCFQVCDQIDGARKLVTWSCLFGIKFRVEDITLFDLQSQTLNFWASVGSVKLTNWLLLRGK